MKKYILIGLLAIISTITSVQAQEERNHGIIWSALHGLEYEIKAESQTNSKSETWLLKNRGEVAEKPIDVAVTLMARDYKGLDNYGSNGVIEWK